MGALVPIATGLTSLVTAVSAVSHVVDTVQTLSGNSDAQRQQDLALRQLQERQRLEAQQVSQDSALEREKIALQATQDEEARRAALKRAVARQKTLFASSGIGTSGGSSGAVLLGLFDETEDELARREQLDNLRNKALNVNEAQSRSLNLLQATQLSERNNLNRLF